MAILMLGVVPVIDVQLPAEDSLELERLAGGDGGVLDLAIVAFPRISNFDELNLLRLEPGVSVRVVHGPSDLGRPDLVLLPGSKTTARDLAELRRTGLADAVVRASRAGDAVLGICGGYQMLGRALEDPAEVEGPATSPGLGLLRSRPSFEPLQGRLPGAPRSVPAQAGPARTRPQACSHRATRSMWAGRPEAHDRPSRSTAPVRAVSAKTAGSSAPACTGCSKTPGCAEPSWRHSAARKGAALAAAGPVAAGSVRGRGRRAGAACLDPALLGTAGP